MPHTVEIDGDASKKGDIEDALFRAWEPYVGRMRRVTVHRVRSRRPTKLKRDIRCQFVASEDNEREFLEGIIADAIELAETDAGERRTKYQFRLWGEAPPNKKEPELCVPAVEEYVCDDSDDDGPRSGSRESELVQSLGEMRTYARDLSREHVSLAKALTSVMEKVGSVTEKLGDALTKNQATAAEWAFKLRVEELSAESRRAESEERSRRSSRAWQAAQGMASQLAPLLDVVRQWQAGTKPGAKPTPPTAPTTEEIEAVFGAIDNVTDELTDLRAMLVALIDATGDEQRAIAAKASERWSTLPNEQKAAFFFAAQMRISPARVPQLLQWLVAVGIKA